MMPSEEIVLGTFAARAGSAFTAAARSEEDPSAGDPDVLEARPLDPPQAASARTSVVVAKTARGGRDVEYRIVGSKRVVRR